MPHPTGVLQALDHFLILKLLVTLTVLYPIGCIVYNIFFHPLRKFPGPKIAAATQLYAGYYVMTGRQVSLSKKLHVKYGEVVRVKPNELSFISESTWKDVYMHRQGQPQMEKARRDHFSSDKDLWNIVNAPDDVHSRQRRSVSHAFSDRALREQEPLMQKYIGLLIDHIRDQAGKGIEFDIVSLLNWTTFDIIGELTFGEPFGALETKHGHPWIDNFFSTMKPVCILFELMEMPGGMFLMNTFIRPILKKKVKMADFVQEKIEKRVERGVGDRPDLMSFVLKNNDEGKGMSKREIITTFNVIIIAGSETTATLLSGAVFLLQKNPRVLQKLKDKVRGTFKDDKEINLLKTAQLPYLEAVIEESLRIYPPAPLNLNRKTPSEGAVISGYHVPGNVVIGVTPVTAYHSPTNFVDPLSFIPERWINTNHPQFKDDKRAVLQSFSAGPRNCVGQNLAYSEMKLILARIIFNFDLELVDKGSDWTDQEAYILWRKTPLLVKVKEASRR